MFRVGLVLLAGSILPSASFAYYAVDQRKPSKEPVCRMVRINRHRPKVCAGGGCEKCLNAECAKKACGITKR